MILITNGVIFLSHTFYLKSFVQLTYMHRILLSVIIDFIFFSFILINLYVRLQTENWKKLYHSIREVKDSNCFDPTTFIVIFEIIEKNLSGQSTLVCAFAYE